MKKYAFFAILFFMTISLSQAYARDSEAFRGGTLISVKNRHSSEDGRALGEERSRKTISQAPKDQASSLATETQTPAVAQTSSAAPMSKITINGQTRFFAISMGIFFLLTIASLVSMFFILKRHFDKRFVNSTEKMRRLFADQTRAVIGELDSHNLSKFQTIEKANAQELARIRARIHDALGKLYEYAVDKDSAGESYTIASAMWYAKSLHDSISANSYSDAAIRTQIKKLISMLEKSPVIYDTAYISELSQVISEIDGSKFAQEKKTLENTVRENNKKTGHLVKV